MGRNWLSVGVSLLALTGWISAISWSQSGQSYAPTWTPPAVQVAGNGSTLMSSVILPTSNQQFVQQMVLVDPNAKTIAVYHIQQDTGVIVMKSVRRIDADLALDEFNSADPAPSKVRSILTQKQ